MKSIDDVYSKRNAKLLEELDNSKILEQITLSDEIVGKSPKRWYVSCGKDKDNDLYLGIKFSYTNEFFAFFNTLVNLNFIVETSPPLIKYLPQVCGLLTPYDANKNRICSPHVNTIITEDFSEGGTLEIQEFKDIKDAVIPDKFKRLYELFSDDEYELNRALFYVGNNNKKSKIIIGDLEHLNPKEEYTPLITGIKQSIRHNLAKYLISFTRKPLEELFLNKDIDRAKEIMNLFNEQHNLLSLENISSSVPIPYESCNRILNTLIKYAYLGCNERGTFDPHNKFFAI